MRMTPLRVARPLISSLIILSCATENAVGPSMPSGRYAGLLAGEPSAPKVVISQVYGAGGNSGASYNRDYIELFNAGGTEQSLVGWSLQYASATGTGNFGGTTTQITPLAGSIAPGEYVLVAESGGSTGAPFVADITDDSPIAMAA